MVGLDFREDLLKTNVKRSLSLIVDTQKKAEDLIKYYNCYEKKINIIPLSPNISALEKDIAQAVLNAPKTVQDVIQALILRYQANEEDGEEVANAIKKLLGI